MKIADLDIKNDTGSIWVEKEGKGYILKLRYIRRCLLTT